MGMGSAIIIANLFTDLGRTGGLIYLGKVTGIGIAIVFFLHGLGLSPSAIMAGLKNWKLHLYVQFCTFVFYPLLWIIFGDLFLSYMPAALAFGFSYLFALPSTISSSVTMTSVGKGNIPAAVFNASLSSIIGVFITPFLIQVFMGMKGAEIDFMTSVISISKLLLLPMAVGQFLRPLLLSSIEKYKFLVNKVDKIIIILIVYNAFCDSIYNGIWGNFSMELIAVSFVICTVVLLFMVHSIQFGARFLGFKLPDEVTAVFCGTKKTLAAGVPMAKVIFATDPRLGMILLPIMLYHPIQIFYCAILANRYARKQEGLLLSQPANES